jgi:hypothetical protein
VWHEHIRLWLSVRDVVRLRGVCKALKGVGRDWPMRLGGVEAGNLEAALACFPAAEMVEVSINEPTAERSRLVEVLRGHGGTLKRVVAHYESGERLLSSAVLAGALPNLTCFNFRLKHSTHREILSGGMLPLLERVDVKIIYEEHVAALEHLRRLPHLRRLSL